MPININSEVNAETSSSYNSVDDLRNNLVNWAKSFNDQYGYYSSTQVKQGYKDSTGNFKLICHYPASDVYNQRQASFDCGGKLNSNGQYIFDCVGWVQFAIYYGLGIPSNYTASEGMYVTPQQGIKDTDYFEKEDASEIKPGDIIVYSNDIAIFIGDNQNLWMSHDSGCGLHIGEADVDVATIIVRFKEEAVKVAKGYTKIDGVTNTSSSSQNSNSQSSASSNSINLDDLDFKLSGIPKTMSYKGTTKVVKNIFSLFAQFIDLLMGLIFGIIKASIIGWMNIIQVSVNYLLYNVCQGEF
jgi:hypothetical protein